MILQEKDKDGEKKTFRKNNFKAGRGAFGPGLPGILPLCGYYWKILWYAQEGTRPCLLYTSTGTPAAAKEDQVPADVTKERFNRLLALVDRKSVV